MSVNKRHHGSLAMGTRKLGQILLLRVATKLRKGLGGLDNSAAPIEGNKSGICEHVYKHGALIKHRWPFAS